jgi:hypothetical protein
MLLLGRGYYTHRIREGYDWHPRWGPDRLGKVVQFHEGKNLVLVRTVRHPVDAIEGQALIDAGRLEALDEMIRLHRAESENTRAAWDAIKRGRWNTPYYPTRVALVTMHYGWFQSGERRWEFLTHLSGELPHQIENRGAFTRYLNETWGKKPVRRGHLSEEQKGARPRILTQAQIERICGELADIVEAEGVEHSTILKENER